VLKKFHDSFSSLELSIAFTVSFVSLLRYLLLASLTSMRETPSKSDANYQTLSDIANLILEIAAVSFLWPEADDLKFPKRFQDSQVIYFVLSSAVPRM